MNYELEEDIEYLYEMPYIDLLKGIKVNNETKTFIYDEGLNLIQYADKKLKWKRGRLLESIEDKETKIEYQYDSNNIRVEKKEIKKAEITKYEVEGTSQCAYKRINACRGQARKSPRPVSSYLTHILTQRCDQPHSRGLNTLCCGWSHLYVM